MIGSLFSGCGGLDMAAQEVFGLPLAFVSDIAIPACRRAGPTPVRHPTDAH